MKSKVYSPAMIMVALMLAEVTCAFETNMITFAMSSLYKIYRDPLHVSWLVTAFLLTSAGSVAICARLGDLYGRRKTLVIILGIAATGSSISAAAHDLNWIIAGRALQGTSMAILPLCIGLVRETWPKDRVAFGVGILMATYAIGTGVGVVLAGLILDSFPWQGIFVCSSILAFIALASVWIVLPFSKHTTTLSLHDLDIWGGMLFVPGVGCLLLGVTKAKEWGWLSVLALGMVGAGALLLAFWWWWEWRHKTPLINVRLLKNRQVALANLSNFLAGVGPASSGVIIYLLMQQPSWTMVGLGASATFAAFMKVPSNLVAGLGSVWAGHVAGKRGARRAMLYATLICLAGWAALAGFHGSILFVAVIATLSQPATAMILGTVPNLLIEAVPQERTSEATGVAQVVRTLGMAIGTQIIFLILASSTISDPSKGPGVFPDKLGFLMAFGFITTVCVALVLAALALPRLKGSADVPEVTKKRFA